MCMYVYFCECLLWGRLWRPEEEVGFPGARAVKHSELLDVGPLEEQQVLLIMRHLPSPPFYLTLESYGLF